MSASSAIEAGRAAAERRMTDTWKVEVVDPAASVDPVTGAGTMTTIYNGRGRLTTNEAVERVADSVGSEVTTQRYSLHLPVSAITPPKNAVATCTASPTDPALVGTKVRVLAGLRKSYATAQRIPVEEVI